MPKPIVLVRLSYENPKGESILSDKYPVEIRFDDLLFAEEVTSERILAVLGKNLADVKLPNGTDISWMIIDAFDSSSIH